VQEGQKEEKKLHAMGQSRQHGGRRGVAGAKPASQGRAVDGLSPGTTASRRPCPCSRVFAASLLFLFNALSWDFFRELLSEY